MALTVTERSVGRSSISPPFQVTGAPVSPRTTVSVLGPFAHAATSNVVITTTQPHGRDPTPECLSVVFIATSLLRLRTAGLGFAGSETDEIARLGKHHRLLAGAGHDRDPGHIISKGRHDHATAVL